MENYKKILIIEDSKTTVEILRDILVKHGFDVDFVHDGVAGLARVESWKPDIVILDLIMPGMDGLSCLHQIKSKPELKKIPVIICTSKTNMKDLFENKGIAGFIEKPVDEKQLLELVQTSLVHSR